MKIVYDWPPNIERIREVFTLHPGIVFTYAPYLFNPDKGFINPPLLKHEELHCRQQGDNPEAWWERYLVDASWRVSQEIPAYRVQFKEIRKLVRSREDRHVWLTKLAKDLSGPMYGSPLTFQKAYRAIKHQKLF